MTAKIPFRVVGAEVVGSQGRSAVCNGIQHITGIQPVAARNGFRHDADDKIAIGDAAEIYAVVLHPRLPFRGKVTQAPSIVLTVSTYSF